MGAANERGSFRRAGGVETSHALRRERVRARSRRLAKAAAARNTSPVGTTPTTFNTAVFFDIENVLGGYDNDAIATVSISQIMDVIRQEGSDAGLVSSIAVNRAYANWSITRLSVLRREIVEQGIEPKQIFGFDRGEKKNAADIELVIEAIDLAYTRPALTTFVVVSGDGGFSSLVKKLHELGKSVLVCA